MEVWISLPTSTSLRRQHAHPLALGKAGRLRDTTTAHREGQGRSRNVQGRRRRRCSPVQGHGCASRRGSPEDGAVEVAAMRRQRRRLDGVNLHLGTSDGASRCSGKEVAASGMRNSVAGRRWEGLPKTEKTTAQSGCRDAQRLREDCWSSCGCAGIARIARRYTGVGVSLWIAREWPPMVMNGLGCGFVR